MIDVLSGVKGEVRMGGRQESRGTVAAVVWVLAGLKVLMHLATAGRYGIFRDELYYVACARHLQWGYVDQPPLIAGVTWLALHVFGSSLLGLRLLPALAGGALVWLAARLARELGGGGFAQIVAAFSVIPVPIYLILNHWLTMNAFEPLLWMGAVWGVLRMIRTGDARWWIFVGAMVGVGLENKYSVALVAVALVCGLLVTPQRRLLRSWWFGLGVLVAVLIFLPNLIWLWRHGFPFLEFERNSRMSGSRILRGPLAFLWDQALMMNPLLMPLAVAGVGWMVWGVKRFRAVGVAVMLVVGVLMALQAKNYYSSGIYPVAFAAGACALDRWAVARVWKWGYVAAAAVLGVVWAPLVMPMLPVPRLVAYERAWGGFSPVVLEDLHDDPLPQYFSDEFGWEEMVRRTATVFHSLPKDEQARTAIFGNNYGEAGAIDFFGPKYGLPEAVSGNESYWLWGAHGYDGGTVIVLGSDGKGDREHFRSVEEVGMVDDPRARSIERFPLLVCRGLYPELGVLWPKLKKW